MPKVFYCQCQCNTTASDHGWIVYSTKLEKDMCNPCLAATENPEHG